MKYIREKDAEWLSSVLLEWWKHNKRTFPWRETREPYEILIAELLLRKTTAQQVAEIFPELLKRYSTPKQLLEDDEERINELIWPLGLEHKRTALLKHFAKYIMDNYNGRIPKSKMALVAIPGVGEYVANAVLCFSYGKDVPTVDTNYIRLMHRFFGIRSGKTRPRNDPWLWKKARQIIPKGQGREFNYAVLDFCASICTARKPDCSKCPAAKKCRYAKEKGL